MNKIKNALCLCNLLSDNCIRGFEELFSVILHIRQLKAPPENGLPYQSNFLDIVNPDENETSKFLKLGTVVKRIKLYNKLIANVI